MPTITVYIDLPRRTAVRSLTSAAPAPLPDFRKPQTYTLNVYLLKRQNTTTENYVYTRYAGGSPQLNLRRNKPPDYCSFTLTFLGKTSAPIDPRLPTDTIAEIISAIPTIGAGNIEVYGNRTDGFIIDFVGDQAGYYQPMFSGAVIAGNGEIVITRQQDGGFGIQGRQLIQLRESPVAVATGWAEIGVPATPGWSASIDTSGIPLSMWSEGLLTMEVLFDAQNVRTGSDGITALEGTSRDGTDGEIIELERVEELTLLSMLDDSGVPYLVANDGTTIYGRQFTLEDVGRVVSEDDLFAIQSGTQIKEVIIAPYYNAAKLTLPFVMGVNAPGKPGTEIMVNLESAPSRVYKSATAAWTDDDVGHTLSGDNLVEGTAIESVIDSQHVTLSDLPTASGTGLTWSVWAVPGAIFQSATAAFTAADVGARIEADHVPRGTLIAAIIDGTHATMSQKALDVGTAQAWTLRAKSGFPAPALSHTQVGSVTQVAKQKLNLSQTPAFGQVGLRDGADSSLPIAYVDAPFTVASIKKAIDDVYGNYGGVTVEETARDNEFEITWGVNGKQHLLVVDETNAVYSPVVAQLALGDPRPAASDTSPPTLPDAPMLTWGWLRFIGVPNWGYVAELTQAKKTRESDGSDAIKIVTRLMQPMNQFTAGKQGDSWTRDTQVFYLDEKQIVEDRGGMRLYDWVGYTMPKNGRAHLNFYGCHWSGNRKNLIQQQRPYYGTARTYQGTNMIDIQIYSISMSTWIYELISYGQSTGPDDVTKGLQMPPDGPGGAVIHFITGSAIFEGFNGFDLEGGTFWGQFAQSWTRRPWHANIWEQRIYVH